MIPLRYLTSTDVQITCLVDVRCDLRAVLAVSRKKRDSVEMKGHSQSLMGPPGSTGHGKRVKLTI